MKSRAVLKETKDDYRAELAKLAQIGMGYRAFKALTVAVELGLFQQLEKCDGSRQELIEKTGIHSRYLEGLLNSLAAVGFLRKEGERYRNTAFSRERLCPDGSRSLVNNLRYQESLSQAYADLAETVKAGRPRRDLGQFLSERPDFVKTYIFGMAEIAREPARQLARALDLSAVQRMLDVGGGHGIFTLTLLEKNPRMAATLLDLPETLRYASDFARLSPGVDRLFLEPGDYHTADFGKGAYDLVLMSHITHDEGPEENMALIRKAHDALRPGGRLVIHDFVTDRGGTGPLFSVLFGLQMLTYTEKGRCYGEDDYREWLEFAGFRSLRRVPISEKTPNATVALVAAKRNK